MKLQIIAATHSYLFISALSIPAYIFICDKCICLAWLGVTQKGSRSGSKKDSETRTVPSSLSSGTLKGSISEFQKLMLRFKSFPIGSWIKITLKQQSICSWNTISLSDKKHLFFLYAPLSEVCLIYFSEVSESNKKRRSEILGFAQLDVN